MQDAGDARLQGLARAATHEHALVHGIARHGGDAADARNRLRTLRSAVEDAVQCADRTAVRTASAKWDAAVAELLVGELMTGLAEVLDYGLRTVAVRDGDRCECGATMREIRRVAPLGGQHDQLMRECPLCVTCDIAREGQARLAIAVGPPLVPGTTSWLRIHAPAACGWLVVEIRDAAGSWSFFRSSAPMGCASVMLSVPVPATVAADLHTMHAAWVNDLDLVVAWRRWSSYRR